MSNSLVQPNIHQSSVNVALMGKQEKIGEALRRSLPHLPSEARRTVEAMLTPTALAIVAGTLIAWAASHAFGVGEIVDVILVCAGIFTIGLAVFDGASELYSFTTKAIDAKNENDLEEAGRHFARAVMLLGISTIMAMLMKKPTQDVLVRGMPKVQPRVVNSTGAKVDIGPPPPAGSRPTTTYKKFPANSTTAGYADAYGNIVINTRLPLNEQKITLLHELVHRFFSPRISLFRKIRAELKMSAYQKSALLRYVEEVLAEGYAQLRMNGLLSAVGSVRFPLDNGYMTVSQLLGEGTAIGTIALESEVFWVTISIGSMPENGGQ